MPFLFRPDHTRVLHRQTTDRDAANVGTGSPKAANPMRIGSNVNPFDSGAAARALNGGDGVSTIDRIGSTQPHREARVVDVRPVSEPGETAPNGAHQDGSGNTENSRSAAPSTSPDDPHAPGPGEPTGLDPAGNTEGEGAEEMHSDDPHAEVEGSDEDQRIVSQEGEGEAGPESGEPSADEGGNAPPIQYLGIPEEEIPEHQKDFAFISAVDPNTRLETVEDVFDSYERLIDYKGRLKSQNQNLQAELARVKQVQDGTVEELRTKLNLYEEQLGEQDLVSVLKQKHMPDKFQGLSEDDLTDPDQQREFYRAEAEAKVKAEQELAERDAKLQKRRQREDERAQEIKDNAKKATEYLAEIDHERLGVPEDVLMEGGLARDIIQQASPGEDQNVFHVAHALLTEHGEAMKPVVDLLIAGLSKKIHEAMDEQRASRMKRIKRRTKKTSSSSTPPPSRAKQPPAYSPKVGEASGPDAWDNAIATSRREQSARQ